MDDATLLALCAFEEANLEPDDGVAAVARVVLNRTARRYQSPGTIAGTIFWPDAFSWTQWEMEAGRYTRVAWTDAETQARALGLLVVAQHYAGAWARALRITAAVQAGTYAGADYAHLTDDTVLYLNPALARAPWATPAKLVCAIGRQDFYRA